MEDVDDYGGVSDANHPEFGTLQIIVKANAHGHDALARSRWFTRGWTLQELIAPTKVIFYNGLWQELGRRDTLLRTLWHITKIDPSVLMDRKKLSGVVVARKMSWAAHRATTRLEDRAYSLLDIFGVNMPLLYGEGEKAFIRLQEEIIKTSTDHSIFAWSSLNPRPHDDDQVDLLFAKSPRDFSHCRKMVRWTPGHLDDEFHLTNRGVMFESIPFFEGQEGLFVILNCRYEDDFDGVVALRLCKGDEEFPTSESDLKQFTGRYDFWIKLTSPDRLVLWDGSKEAQSWNQRITLLRYRPIFHAELGDAVTAARLVRRPDAPKFWLVNTTSSGEGFCILEAYPQELWNHASGVLCPLLTTAQTNTGKASVLIEGMRSKIRFSLAFEPAKLGKLAKLDYGGFSLVISSRSQEKARKVFARGTTQEAYVDPEGPVRSGVSATATDPVNMFGD